MRYLNLENSWVKHTWVPMTNVPLLYELYLLVSWGKTSLMKHTADSSSFAELFDKYKCSIWSVKPHFEIIQILELILATLGNKISQSSSLNEAWRQISNIWWRLLELLKWRKLRFRSDSIRKYIAWLLCTPSLTIWKTDSSQNLIDNLLELLSPTEFHPEITLKLLWD